MKALFPCCGQRAVKVSDSSCSARRRPLISRFLKPPRQSPASQNSVSCVYESELVSSSEMKKVLITLTWTRNLDRKGLDLEFVDRDVECKYEVRKPRGCASIEFNGSEIELCWNLSKAEYENGCEPTKNFHLNILIDSELCLRLGDNETEKSMELSTSPVAKTVYFTRRESFVGNAFYATKTKFFDDGNQHDFVIKCIKETERPEAEGGILLVLVDGRKTVHVGNLHWNFRGSQTIFVDGLVVDIMWDVRGWFSRSGQAAVFLFRTRTGIDSRLWFEEKNLFGAHLEFSLVICGSEKMRVD